MRKCVGMFNRLVSIVDQLPVRRKLTLAALLTSILAVLLSSGIFTVFFVTTSRRDMADDLVTQANIVANNSTGALVFEDAVAASEILSALSAKSEIEFAALYTSEGAALATYGDAPSGGQALASALKSRVIFGRDYLDVVRVVTLDGATIGWVQISSNLDQWYAYIYLHIGLLAGLCSFAGLLTVPVSSRLQRVVSEPLLRLENSIEKVSRSRDYSFRARVESSDEVGRLTVGFNELLDELEMRAAEEKTLNETLEERVAERSHAAELRSKELAHSENELKKQTRILESVLDSMADGVLVANESGDLILSNHTASALFGIESWKEKTVRADTALLLYLPGTVAPIPWAQHPLQRAIGGVPVDGAEYLASINQSLEDVWLTVNARPLTGEYGGGVLVFRDITAVRLREQELRGARDSAESASRAKSMFVANMSHELRTPLNAILGYSEMLVEQMEENEDSDYLDDLNKINSAGKHLLSITNDILDLSKIETGRMEASLQTLEFNKLLEEVVTTVRPLAQKNSNELHVVVPDTIRMVSDATKLKQILLNLLSNACKFTENGSVTLTAKLREVGQETLLDISVKDTGIGMEPAQAESLFEPFVQADASTARKYGGTGLGLAISRQMCRLLAGDLTVESVTGKGSIFHAWIPIALQKQDVPTRSDSVILTPDFLYDAVAEDCVVIIDDDDDTCALLSWLVLKEGLRPVLCHDSKRGIDAIRRHRPKAVTLDVMMDGTDGWTVLGFLKADSDLRHIPVVMVTVDDDMGRAQRMGAVAHVTKPINTATFQQAIRGCKIRQPKPGEITTESRVDRSA